MAPPFNLKKVKNVRVSSELDHNPIINKKSIKDFLGERVVNYWNNLPSSVRSSSSVDMFKCNLEAYKLSSIDTRFQASTNRYWEVSEHVLSRIETPSALAGRSALCEYWSENPWVARKKGVNLFYKQLTFSSLFHFIGDLISYSRVVLYSSYIKMPFWF